MDNSLIKMDYPLVLLTTLLQCRPIGNMLKTIDFIGVLKIGWRFNRPIPSYSIWSWQKAHIFGSFHVSPVG